MSVDRVGRPAALGDYGDDAMGRGSDSGAQGAVPKLLRPQTPSFLEIAGVISVVIVASA
jgi:hypothetical protein